MSNAFLQRVYLAGYKGHVMPRWLRRIVARSTLHHAWLSGFTGCFSEGGVSYGPPNPYGRDDSSVTASDRN